MTNATITFNPREVDILNILLNSSEPMTSMDIVNSGDMQLSQSTVIAVLRKLLHDGYVEVVGVTYAGKVLSRTYVATELARTNIPKYCATLYQPFVAVIGISPLINSIVSSLDEDMKKKVLADIKKL